MFSMAQYGFQKSRFYATCNCDFLNYQLQLRDLGQSVTIAHQNFSKAFDKVSNSKTIDRTLCLWHKRPIS